MANELRAALISAAALGLLVGSAVSTLAAVTRPNASACGLPDDTPVIASFDATPAKAIWKRLPALGKSPELEEVTGTAHVLVLGDVTPPGGLGGFGAQAPAVLPNAVCVVLPDGPVLYYNVSRQGFTAP